MMNLTTFPTLSTPSDFHSVAIGGPVAAVQTPEVAGSLPSDSTAAGVEHFTPGTEAVVIFEAAMSKPMAENAALQAALESIVANFDVEPRTSEGTPPMSPVAPQVSPAPSEPPVAMDTPATPETVGRPVAVEVKPEVAETPAPVVAETAKPVVAEPAKPVVPGVKPAAVEEHVPVVAETAKPVVAETKSVVVEAKPIYAEESKHVAGAKSAIMPDDAVADGKPDEADIASVVVPVAVAAPAPTVEPVVEAAGVASLSPVVLAKVEAATAAEILVEAATAVADTMHVTPGLKAGEGEVLVRLKPDVLAESELKISVSGAEVKIEFIPTVERIATLISENQAGLVQHLAERVGNFNFVVAVNRENLRGSAVGARIRDKEES